jgi:DNA primase
MAKNAEKVLLRAAGREVAISNPDKVLFPQAGYTKLDLARYYLAVADGALRGAGNRPNVLVRYPNGIDGNFFFQKRAPTARPRSRRASGGRKSVTACFSTTTRTPRIEPWPALTP